MHIAKVAYTQNCNPDPMGTSMVQAAWGWNSDWMDDPPNTWFPSRPYHYSPPDPHCGWSKKKFNQSCGNPRACPCERWMQPWVVHTHSRCSPLKGGSILQGPSHFRDARFRIMYRVRPTLSWSNTIISVVGNSGVVSLSITLCHWEVMRKLPMKSPIEYKDNSNM